MKRLHRTYHFILGAIFAVSILLVLDAALPALAHNGIVHGEDSEPAQTVQTDSTSTDAEAATTTEPSAASAQLEKQTEAKQIEAQQTEAKQASIGVGEWLLGAIVLGPIALTQLRVKRSR